MPGVEGLVDDGRSVAGEPLPVLWLGPTGLTPGGEASEMAGPVGAYICWARGEEVLPLRVEPERVRWSALWGEGPAFGIGALFDVTPGTGVEVPD
jgi:hypothetical protein